MRKLMLLLAAVAAAWGALACSQETVFRVNVRLVRLLVTVKDASGQLVGSLNKEDFSVLDSGVGQQVTVFERHTEQPLSIALLVDTSASTAKELKYEIDSSAKFLRALVREGNAEDALSFYTFNHDVTLQAGFTRTPARIERLFQRIRAEAGTSVYDALWFAAEHLSDREGRHVIVIVSDGNDTTSVRTYQEALRAVHLSDAVIYPIVVTPVTSEAGRNLGGEHALIGLSRSTGGRAFFPSLGLALDQVFTDILRELRTQYMLGYYPKNLPESKNKFRTIEVKLKAPELRVLTRGGYYEE